MLAIRAEQCWSDPSNLIQNCVHCSFDWNLNCLYGRLQPSIIPVPSSLNYVLRELGSDIFLLPGIVTRSNPSGHCSDELFLAAVDRRVLDLPRQLWSLSPVWNDAR